MRNARCCIAKTFMPTQPSPPEPHSDTVHTVLRIQQMDCPTEEALLRKKLQTLAGVSGLQFHLMQRRLTVTHAPQVLDQILAAVRALGFTPELEGAAVTSSTSSTPSASSRPGAWWRLALAGVLASASQAMHWMHAAPTMIALLAMLALLACGPATFKKGWIALRHANLNIHALMGLAVAGALLLQQWPEAAMVLVLFTLAERLEARSLDHARQAIHSLMQLAPETASVLQDDGHWHEMAARAVPLKASVRVRPGERIALDGRVTRGFASLNQAPITGESLPVDKQPGDPVFAGSINGATGFEYQVSALADHSTLARIIHAVEAAQQSKAPTQRFVDRFARIYTPLVVALALALALLPPLCFGGDWSSWVYKGLVLLVIACPCALVISTPVTIVSGLAAAARQGILVKGGAYLEQGRLLRWLALDKTGTLTQGQPAVTDFFATQEGASLRLRSLAASLAVHSAHPLSRAIANAARQDGIPLQPVEQPTALSGRGIQGQIEGQRLYLGNRRLMHACALPTEALEPQLCALEDQGKTVVLLADANTVLAVFALADTLRAGSRQAIAALHALGIQTIMLSGDNRHTVRAMTTQLSLDDARAELLPEDKLRAIEALMQSGARVGMVGDGINDAPALARADIGFAMGAAGSDTAIEAADVALMDDDLGKLARFVQLSHATHALLLQNIALALGIKGVFLLLTLFGMGTLWMAVFADVGASLLVVANGLRLLRK